MGPGRVLGLIELNAGIWRVGLGPRFLAPALALFIVLEFAGRSPIVSLVAGALYLAVFGTLAHTVLRSPIQSWVILRESRESQRVTS